jgi:hypothetical protein
MIVYEKKLINKNNCPPLGAGSFDVFFADSVVKRFLMAVRTLVS